MRTGVISMIDRWTALGARRSIAKPLVMLGSAVIFAAAAVDGQLPQPWFAGLGSGPAGSIIGVGVAAAAALAACRFAISDLMSLVTAAAWFTATCVGAVGMLAGGPDVGLTVALVEGAALSAACLAIAHWRIPAILHYLPSAMLVVFGSVHLLWHDAIAQLIPGYVPFAGAWPWVTGSLQVAAGLAGISVRLARILFTLIAAMFLAWIPLVHLPRIFADPSTGEFSFAAMAAALAGCLFLAARRLDRLSHPASQQ